MIHFVFLLFLSLSFGQELLTLDYKKVYELALRNNKDIQRLQEQIRAFEVDYQLAQRYYLPIVYAGASILYDMDNKETKTNVNLSIISTLYEFQKTKSRIELSRIKRDIAQIMLDQLNRDIQLRIIKLFADAHLYKKLTEVKREEMAIAYVRFDRARERKELGLATDYEVFRLESIFREKRSELFYAQHMYNHTLLEIKQLAGIPYETLIEVEDLPFKELEKPLADFSTLREEALKNNAIEFRINAEDPRRNFAPAPGKITAYYSPGGPGIRMDAGVYKDYVIPPYYDSMIAKMSVWALSWDRVLARARRAIDEFIIRGVPTNIPLHREIIRDPDFISGYFGIRFLEEKLPTYDFEIEGEKDPETLALALSAAIAAYYGL